MRDQATEIEVRPSLAPATRTTTAAGSSIDRAGFEAVSFALIVGAYTDGEHTLTLEHSDDDEAFDAVPAEQVVGEAVATEEGSPAMPTLAGMAAVVGYVGGKRYVKPSVTVTVTGSPSTGAATSVVAILGHAHNRPTS